VKRAVTLLACAGFAPLAAQSPWVHWGVLAVPTLTSSNVVPGRSSLGELRIIQPMAMVRAAAPGDRLRLMLTADFEKWTIPHGQLAPGNWGEGFEDRRHPHTVVHELVLVAPDLLRGLSGPLHLFVAGGKGFAPFGTDDPMVRPTVIFPVNHHLGQILERAVAIAGVRAGPVLLEGGLYNGDEPLSPGSWPAWKRFGDSWSTRLTVTPLAGLETQVSHAWIKSPENRPGAGLDQAKWDMSARWDRRGVYALAEWARTSEGQGAFVYHSLLAEGALTGDRHRPYARFERTERPEEERRFETAFRTVRPLQENGILGITRWTIVTVGDTYEISPWTRVHMAPFVEASHVSIAKVGGGIFDPSGFYGQERGFTLSAGIRLGYGMTMHRMGRYAPEAPASGQGMRMSRTEASTEP
jgi:hypothetical protein